MNAFSLPPSPASLPASQSDLLITIGDKDDHILCLCLCAFVSLTVFKALTKAVQKRQRELSRHKVRQAGRRADITVRHEERQLRV